MNDSRPGQSTRQTLPGSRAPERRLAVTPLQLDRLAPRAFGLNAKFPYTKAAWPSDLPRPAPRRRLGVDYDTTWARSYPARFTRVLLTELVTAPAAKALAAPRVSGLDRISALAGPVIFAPNHTSHLDTPLILSVLPEPWRHHIVVAAGADYFFDTRLKAVAFSLATNAIPIERTRVSRDSARRAADLLGQGWSLLIYPEGGRSPDGWAQPHRAGAAWLSARSGRPIVPVHIEGTGSILPRHARRPRLGTTKVTFGRALYPQSSTDARALAARLEAAVAALADESSTDWWSATKRAGRGATPALSGPQAAGAWRRTWALGPRRSGRGG